MAKNYPRTYDLVAFFDCLHDMGDPVGAAAHVRETIGSRALSTPPSPAARRRQYDIPRLRRREHVGADHRVVVRRQLVVDAVEALEVVASFAIRSGDCLSVSATSLCVTLAHRGRRMIPRRAGAAVLQFRGSRLPSFPAVHGAS